ncbi:MAG: hypothetical protein U5K37_02185 [Natrialbaceae archaeon]|nr:hypothetical protein [Natrialbaceae archaeon]
MRTTAAREKLGQLLENAGIDSEPASATFSRADGFSMLERSPTSSPRVDRLDDPPDDLPAWGLGIRRRTALLGAKRFAEFVADLVARAASRRSVSGRLDPRG